MATALPGVRGCERRDYIFYSLFLGWGWASK